MFSFTGTAQEAVAGGRSGAAGMPVHGSLMWRFSCETSCSTLTTCAFCSFAVQDALFSILFSKMIKVKPVSCFLTSQHREALPERREIQSLVSLYFSAYMCYGVCQRKLSVLKRIA